jgi:hypothetical protein
MFKNIIEGFEAAKNLDSLLSSLKTQVKDTVETVRSNGVVLDELRDRSNHTKKD